MRVPCNPGAKFLTILTTWLGQWLGAKTLKSLTKSQFLTILTILTRVVSPHACAPAREGRGWLGWLGWLGNRNMRIESET